MFAVVLLACALTAGLALATGGDDSSPAPAAGSTDRQASALSGTVTPSSHTERPNILFIVTDDQRAEGTVIPEVMPKTRTWFKDGGTYFPNAFATTPICCPSRASIMSGRYVHNHQVFENNDATQFNQDLSIQRYLQDAGYQTALVGKFLNLWPLNTNPQYWNRWRLSGSGYCPFVVNEQGTRVRYPPRQEPHNPDNECFPEFLGRRADSPYETDYLTEQAVDFISDQEASDAAPWFLYLTPYAPHPPQTPEADYKDAPVPESNGNPATFEADLRDKPKWVRGNQTTRQDVFGDSAGSPADPGMRKEGLRALMSVDDQVQAVMQKLEELGEQNTLAIFISDNGNMWGEHGLMQKGHAYEDSIAIPFYARWPDHLVAGAVDQRMVANIDLAPTALDAADLPAPVVPMDGRSILDTAYSRDRTMLEWYRIDEDPESLPSWAGLRTPSYHYIESYADDLQTPLFREFYDLAADPFELSNRYGFDGIPNAGDPPSSPPASTLASQLAADRVCSGASCP